MGSINMFFQNNTNWVVGYSNIENGTCTPSSQIAGQVFSNCRFEISDYQSSRNYVLGDFKMQSQLTLNGQRSNNCTLSGSALICNNVPSIDQNNEALAAGEVDIYIYSTNTVFQNAEDVFTKKGKVSLTAHSPVLATNYQNGDLSSSNG